MNPLHAPAKAFLEERDRWPLWLPVGIGVGIALYFALDVEPPLWALLASPVLIVGIWLGRRHLALLIPALTLFCLALGFNAAQLDTRMSYTPMLDRDAGPLPVTGRLVFTEVLPEGVRLTLKDLTIGHWDAARTPTKIRLKLNNKTLTDIPPAGSRINLFAQVGPFSEPVLPGANDFRRQFYFKQIGGLGWSFSKINALDPAEDQMSWRDKFNLMFERARLTLAEHVYARLSGDVAAMTATRLNGEQTAISEPVIEAMRIAGLAHLLSTSGFHVTIMGLLVYFPLRALFAAIPFLALHYPIKKWAAVGAICSTMGYTFLVGAQAATMRSMVMTGIAMLAILIDRRAAPMRLVMLSAAIVMLMTPDALLGPSFQMSFAAVFCLIASHGRSLHGLVSPDLAAPFPGWVRAPFKYLATIFTTSLIATAATTPFAAYHFQTFSFYGFAANMLAIPLTSFWVMPCLLLAYILVPFGMDGWLIDIAGSGIKFTIQIATMVAHWPYSIIYHLPAVPIFALSAVVIGGLWLCLWHARMRWLGLLPILIGLAYPLYTPQPDVMISPDGKVWAARLDDGRLAVSNMDKDKFVYEQWQQRLAMPPVVDVFELPPAEQQLRCDDLGCVYHHGGHSVAFPTLESAAFEDCAQADIVVATMMVKDCAAKHVIDDLQLWKRGAHSLRFTGDAVVIEDTRDRRAERPWSPGWRPNKDDEE